LKKKKSQKILKIFNVNLNGKRPVDSP